VEETPPGFPGWAEALAYAARLARDERLVLVIDEFPYLALSDPSLPSVIQRVWDGEARGSQLMLVLCGSSISYMEGEVLSSRSPLFGRRDAQIHLRPMGLPEASACWKGYGPEDAVRCYAVLGGVPAYAVRFDAGVPLAENIQSAVLAKDACLFEEVPFLLMQELREPRIYLAVLQAIAAGETTQNESAMAAGLTGSQAAPYLRAVAALRLVERGLPVQEPMPGRSRRGSYRAVDPFFRFWLRFVLPNRSRLEQGLVRAVFQDAVAPHLDVHVSRVFEELAADHLRRLARGDPLPIVPARIGPRTWEFAPCAVRAACTSRRSSCRRERTDQDPPHPIPHDPAPHPPLPRVRLASPRRRLAGRVASTTAAGPSERAQPRPPRPAVVRHPPGPPSRAVAPPPSVVLGTSPSTDSWYRISIARSPSGSVQLGFTRSAEERHGALRIKP
jgi:AAA+ ATPase superfamily predicted ATPase